MRAEHRSLFRPEPSHGVFETLLAVDGEPVELGGHLDRLAASVQALYGSALPAAAGRLLLDGAAERQLARLRLTVSPGAGGLECRLDAEAVSRVLLFPELTGGAELVSCRLQGGLGAHKWADRSALPVPAHGSVPLLLDDGDELLEAGWANVFLVRDGGLQTPRADGRILPGVTRAAVIAASREAGIEVQERRLRRQDLLDADEVFLTASVRGIVPARSLDGARLGGGELSRLVAERLRGRWLAAGDEARAPEPAGAPSPDRRAR